MLVLYKTLNGMCEFVRLCFVSCRVGGINRVFIPTCHGIRLRVGANALNHLYIRFEKVAFTDFIYGR